MKLAGIFALLALFISSSALAQQARQQVELSRSVIQTERQIIVANNMSLTEQEAEGFWPVYKDFQEALRKVSDRRADLILELAREFNSLSGEKAQEMLKESLNIQAARTKLKQKFISKFNKVRAAWMFGDSSTSKAPASLVSSRGNVMRTEVNETAFRECMRGRGWKLR